jgi:flagellar biosynthesis protein FlhB
MADQDAQDRNLPASARKLKKARDEGQVARSQDFGHFVMIAVCGATLVTVAPMLTDWMKEAVMEGLRFNREAILNPGFMGERLLDMTIRLLWVVIPFGSVMVAAALLSNVAIGGWNWTLQPIMPSFGKLNPLTGLPGMISKDKLIGTLKGCALALILGVIGGFYLKNHIESFAGLLAVPLPMALHEIGSSMVGGLGLLLLALAGFAMVDVPLQRYQHAQRLKMSHQELKQEQKEQEGSQQVKQKIKARMREMTKRRMLAAVPKADLVVMNPTHYAVALKYDDTKMGAPRVVAKGADLLAMRIRDLAKDSKVPVLQAPALARALFAHAELDREIPAALFAAVAQVLAYVYQLKAALTGQVAMPADLPELEVPAELDPHNVPVETGDEFLD